MKRTMRLDSFQTSLNVYVIIKFCELCDDIDMNIGKLQTLINNEGDTKERNTSTTIVAPYIGLRLHDVK